jgi:hypothetical protein
MRYLEHLWYEDHRARLLHQVLTVVISFAYGIFNALVLKRPENRITWETVCIAFSVTAVLSAVYCVRARTSELKVTSTEAVRDPVSQDAVWGFNRLVYAGLGSVLLVMLFIARPPANRVYAAALDFRLRSLIASPNASDPENIGKMVAALKAASGSGLRIKPGLVDAASSRVADASLRDPSLWHSTLGIMGYRSTQTDVANRDLNKTSCINNGDTSSIHTAVSYSQIDNCSQVLDGVEWNGVVFQDVVVIYHGGPTKLKDNQFKNCHFFVDYSPAGQELVKALAASSSVTIDLSNQVTQSPVSIK